MKRIKKFLLNKIISNKKHYARVERLHKKITEFLAKQEHNKLIEYIDEAIASLDVDNTTANAMRTVALSSLTSSYVFDRYRVPRKQVLNITLNLMKNLSNNLGNIVSIQPIPAPVAQVFRMEYSTFEDGKMALELKSNAVEVKTNKSQIQLPIAKGEFGVDIEHSNEMEKIIALELEEEITSKVLASILTNAKHEEFDMSSGETIDFVSDKINRLLFKIRAACNLIAMDTHLGAGNFIVASPMIVTILSNHPDFESNKTKNFSSSLMHVGTLDKTIEVYSRIPELTRVNNDSGYFSESIIVGYKRGFSTGYIYSPYIIGCMEPSINEHFVPKHDIFERSSSTMFDSSFYRIINVKNLSFI